MKYYFKFIFFIAFTFLVFGYAVPTLFAINTFCATVIAYFLIALYVPYALIIIYLIILLVLTIYLAIKIK